MSRFKKRKRVYIPNGVRIRKTSGEYERFSPTKLKTSLIRCGTPVPRANEITQAIQASTSPRITPVLSTDAIRRLAFQHLKRSAPAAATRYQLSRAVMKLGPSGFPFEKLIGLLYQSEGYRVEVNQLRPGRCVNHEIDVIATKNGKRTFIECKFHQTPGSMSDLKTALYVKARSLDLNQSSHEYSHHDRFVLLTNTRFSSEAMAYGLCAELDLISWSYPNPNSLAHRLEVSGLIPLTALTTIQRRLAEVLMNEGIITIRDLVEHPRAWRMLGRDPKRLESVQREIDHLFEVVQ